MLRIAPPPLPAACAYRAAAAKYVGPFGGYPRIVTDAPATVTPNARWPRHPGGSVGEGHRLNQAPRVPIFPRSQRYRLTSLDGKAASLFHLPQRL